MILRATQFFECFSQIVEAGGEGDRVEIGRPEALGVDAWGRRLFAAIGDERTVIGDPQARYFGTELHVGELTPGNARASG